MSSLFQDLRYSVRLLLKTPAFSATAVLVLALGIGANVAVFTLVDTLLLRPRDGAAAPGELVGIYRDDRTRPDSYNGFSYPALLDIRERATIFSHVSGFSATFVGMGEGDVARRTFAAVVPGNYFTTLGTELMSGRTFTADEERPGSQATSAIVSYDYWKSHGSDPALVGKTVKINARPYTVVGIARAGFTGTSVMVSPDVWLPTGAYELVDSDITRDTVAKPLSDRSNGALLMVGRLKPGITQAAAAAPLEALARQLEEAYPAENKNLRLTVHSLSRVSISTNPQDDSDMIAPFAILMLMAGIVLLIACLNLANMMLARGTARRKEIAMRLALGGSRGRIVRQLLTEASMLSLVAGVLGVVLGYWGISVLVSSLLPLSPIPLTFDARPDLRVAGATLLFCALSTVLFSLGPGWKLARTDALPELKEQAGEAPRGRRGRWFGARNLLVATQIALSLGLLTAAGLFTRGALKAGEADPGYRLEGQVVASLDTSLAGYDEARARDAYRRLVERVRAMPGVRTASLASTVAFGGFTEGKTVARVGTAGKDGRPPRVNAVTYVVGSDYFQALGVPILRGRGFSAGEEQDANAPRVAVIDEPLAKALFPGESPIGQQIRIPPPDEAAPVRGTGVVTGEQGEDREAFEIVGVVAGLRHEMFDKAPVAHFYLPFGRNFRAGMHVHARLTSQTREAEAAALTALRREVRAVDERLPLLGLKTLTEHRDSSILYWVVRAGAQMFTVFGAVAVFLAVVGLYAVKAYVVARRTREIGIRMALGSSPSNVLWLVLKEGLGLTVAGLAVGLLFAVGIGQVVSSMLYEVQPFDPVVFGAAPLLLALAALAACYLPARRATRIAPVVALRTE